MVSPTVHRIVIDLWCDTVMLRYYTGSIPTAKKVRLRIIYIVIIVVVLVVVLVVVAGTV